LKDDPAVVMAELINEDSLFFWTFNPEPAIGSNVRETFLKRNSELGSSGSILAAL
jgi:hypothetical protein